MANYTSYIIFWMILFVLLGAFWYVVDRRYGIKWYRRFYGWTHAEPLPADIQVGFIYNRRSRHKAVMATVLSTLQTLIALYSVESLNLLVELILWLVEIPMTMLGFALGPFAFKLWGRKDRMLDALDDFEAKHLTKSTGEPEDERAPQRETAATRPTESPTPDASKPTDVPAEPVDPKKMFDRYTKR